MVLLSDWTDQDPETIVSNLKQQSDYYNHGQRTLGSFVAAAEWEGLRRTIADRLFWGGMRMSPSDIADVSGATYTYLRNGQGAGGNWTGLFRPGERVRLHLINASAMTFFAVQIPGLTMSVVAADGNELVPVALRARHPCPARRHGRGDPADGPAADPWDGRHGDGRHGDARRVRHGHVG